MTPLWFITFGHTFLYHVAAASWIGVKATPHQPVTNLLHKPWAAHGRLHPRCLKQKLQAD